MVPVGDEKLAMNRKPTVPLEKRSATPPGPTPLCGTGGIPRQWTDVRGFVNAPHSQKELLIRSRSIAKNLAFQAKTEQITARPGSNCAALIHGASRPNVTGQDLEGSNAAGAPRTKT